MTVCTESPLTKCSSTRTLLRRRTSVWSSVKAFGVPVVVEGSGQHKQELDSKTFGTCPIVNVARLLALDAGIEATNTVDRLSAVHSITYLDDILRRDLLESFELLTLLRLEHQLQQSQAARPLSNYVNPGNLTHLQRGLRKEAFQTITRTQSAISDHFRAAVWAQLGS